MLSALFAGEVTLLPFPYLRVGVLLSYGVSGVCGLRRRSRLAFVVRHPVPVSIGPSPFLGLGWLGHRFVAPPATSDARLHRPDALAPGRTLSFCRRGSIPWAFILPWVSRPRPCLGSSLLLVVLTFPCPGFSLGASGRGMVQAPALSWALPWVLPSRFQCWLLAWGG